MLSIQFTEYGESDVLEIVEVNRPKPASGEIRLDVKAIGINFKDIRQRLGLVPVDEFPFVPGMEAAGVIDAVGPNVNRSIGQKVVVRVHSGAYAEAVTAPEELIFDIPNNVSFSEAAGFPVQFLTAYGVLFNRGNLEADDRVLIHAAAGGVGTAAVQLASAAGAEVFGTASTAAKLKIAAELGVDHPINYTEKAFEKEVNRITKGGGVDLVLDGVGGEVFNRSLEALAPYGSIITYGAASGESGCLEDTTHLYGGNNAILGFHLTNTLKYSPEKLLPAIGDLSDRLAKGALRVIVGEKYPFEEVGRAHDYLFNRESSGKVILTV